MTNRVNGSENDLVEWEISKMAEAYGKKYGLPCR